MNKFFRLLCLGIFASPTLYAMNNVPDEKQRNEQLHEAITNNNISLATALINQGVSVNAKSYGWTPLIKAVVLGRKEICALLIEKNAPVDERDDSNCTPLFRAIVSNHAHICELLIEKKASIDADADGWTTLMQAAAWARNNICEVLIKKNASINTKTSDGNTALIIAANRENEQTSRILIDCMVESIKQKWTALLTLVGIKKFRKKDYSRHASRDVMHLIIQQAWELIKHEKKQPFDQIDDMRYLKLQLRAYAKRRIFSEIKEHDRE